VVELVVAGDQDGCRRCPARTARLPGRGSVRHVGTKKLEREGPEKAEDGRSPSTSLVSTVAPAFLCSSSIGARHRAIVTRPRRRAGGAGRRASPARTHGSAPRWSSWPVASNGNESPRWGLGAPSPPGPPPIQEKVGPGTRSMPTILGASGSVKAQADVDGPHAGRRTRRTVNVPCPYSIALASPKPPRGAKRRRP